MQAKYMEHWKPSNKVLTLGSLYAKDLPNGYILPEYPSSFDPKAKFLNNEKYLIQDYPPYSRVEVQYLECFQHCPVVGNELPTLLRNKPGELLKRHWKRWLPFFPEADMRDLTLEGTEDSKLFTIYPLQWLPRDKHAVDPDVHHKILSKNTIPEMGANCPRHMSLHDYTVPCMIKASHGSSGKGTYMAKTKTEAEEIIDKMKNELRCPEPSISEVIEDITGNYCVQFYLYKTGDIEWLGCVNQVIDEDFGWAGANVNWNEQDELKHKLYDTVMPVKEYLHKNGYFGVVGIDVLSNKEGNFVVDINARINGSTLLLFLTPHLAEMGFPISSKNLFLKAKRNEIEVMEMIDKINDVGEGRVINVACVGAEDGKSCDVIICIFAKNEESMKNIHTRITNYLYIAL